jgi:hypothetical protein
MGSPILRGMVDFAHRPLREDNFLTPCTEAGDEYMHLVRTLERKPNPARNLLGTPKAYINGFGTFFCKAPYESFTVTVPIA